MTSPVRCLHSWETCTAADMQGLAEAHELYATYRAVIDERVPGLGPSSSSKRVKY